MKCRFSLPLNAKPKYYHYYDKNHVPRVTVCKLYLDTQTIASIGLAVCGKITPSKKIMRHVAYGRAVKAYSLSKNSDKMTVSQKNLLYLTNMPAHELRHFNLYPYKSYINLYEGKF